MPQLTHLPSSGRVTNGWNAPPALPGSPRHRGIDYGTGAGLAIYAAAAAPIIYAGPSGRVVAGTFIDAGYGNIIVQDLGDGFIAIYGHIKNNGFRVRSGTPAAGQHIADKGATGRVTAAHLHFEIRKNGIAIDPTTLYTRPAAGGSPAPILEVHDMPKIISVPGGTIAFVSEFSGRKYGSPTDFSLGANRQAYGEVGGFTEDQVTTLVGEANQRGATLVANTVAELRKATPTAAAAIDYDALAAALKRAGAFDLVIAGTARPAQGSRPA